MTDTMRDRLRRWGQPALLGLLLGLLLVGCDGGVQGSSPPPDGAIDAGPDATVDVGLPDAAAPMNTVTYEPLPPTQRLLRASMALRGQRPSLEEYAAVQADADAYAELVDAYLRSPAFGATMRQHFTEWMELDQTPDAYPAGFPAIGDLAGIGTHRLNTSIIQAAGRLAEHVIMNDRPWSEIVTADYTLADGIVATVWGLPYDVTGPEWQLTAYTDGRPAAGVLSDGWVFTRMPSTENNRQRERASLIASALICHDYPGRPVDIPPDLDLTNEDAIQNAVEQNPACVSCHHTLDPLAAYFAVHYDLRLPPYVEAYPLEQYTPQNAANYRQPAWYGEPSDDLGALGRQIAADSRFATCAVRRVYSELMQVPVEDVPQAAIARLLPVFRDSDLNVRALVRAIALSPAFSAVEATGPGAPDVGLRRATPQQLDTLVYDLTGFRWQTTVEFDLGSGQVGEVPLMRDYLWGYRTLAGAPNNFDTTTHLRTANPSTLLVLKALAERAAAHAVADGSLFTVEGAFDGDPAAVQAQLSEWMLRIFGVPDADTGPAEALLTAAWQGDDARAWTITLAGILQDPRVLFY